LRKYHHLGIPTTEVRAGERYLAHLKFHVSGCEQSPYGIEWMRFDADCPMPDLVKTVPHVAFEVDDLDAELCGKQVLIAPNSPSPGVRVAFIVHDGAPVEFLEFRRGAVDRAGESQTEGTR
jgi:hypothetical protein